MAPLLVALAVYLLLGTVAYALYAAVSNPHRALEDKLEDLAVRAMVAQGAHLEGRQARGFGRMLLMWAARRMPVSRLDTPKGAKLARTLAQAGYSGSSAVRVFQVIRLGALAAGAMVGLSISLFAGLSGGSAVIWIAAGTVIGVLAPSYYVINRARARQEEIERYLSDAMDLLVVCVEAGLGLHEAIRVVGTEVARQGQAIGKELALVAAEMRAGKTLGEALHSFADRTAVEDVKPLAATLIQSEQLGAQIAPALRPSSDQLRMRRRLRAEEYAQKTVIKILFPLVLFVLPAMLIVIVAPAIIQILKAFSR